MANESKKEQIKQAAVEFAKVEVEYFRAKEKFDKVFESMFGLNGVERELEEIKTEILGPLTRRVLETLPKDGRPMAIKQIAAMVLAEPKVVSATCSNLKSEGKVESAGYGLWRLKSK